MEDVVNPWQARRVFLTGQTGFAIRPLHHVLDLSHGYILLAEKLLAQDADMQQETLAQIVMFEKQREGNIVGN